MNVDERDRNRKASPFAEDDLPPYLRANDRVVIHRSQLPHWRQAGVMYFVTCRLCDSIPVKKRLLWQEERQKGLESRGLSSVRDLDRLSEKERRTFHRRFTDRWQTWLDAGEGECLLREPNVRRLLVDRLLASPESSCLLDAWVVMPNHFHALVTPEEATLGEIVRHWKGGSAYDINRRLERRGSLWQEEPYDSILRSEAQWVRVRRYIAENPLKARLPEASYSVGIGKTSWDAARAMLDYLDETQPPELKL